MGHRQTQRLITLAACLLTCCATGNVCAQYAVGDGHALDANFSSQGRYNQSRSSYLLITRLNDSIVTGNVGGGREFRGDVGYTASFEFRDSLGSNDLYRFNADSYRPSIVGRPGAVDLFQLSRSGTGPNLASLARSRYGATSRSIDAGGAWLRNQNTIREYDQAASLEPGFEFSGSSTGTTGNLANVPTMQSLESTTMSSTDPLLSQSAFGTQLRLAPTRVSNSTDLQRRPGVSNSVDESADEDSAPVEKTIDDVPFEVGLQQRLQSLEMKVDSELVTRLESGQDLYIDLLAPTAAAASDLTLPGSREAYSDELLAEIAAMRERLRVIRDIGVGTTDSEQPESPGDQGALSAPDIKLPTVETFAGDTKSRFDASMKLGQESLVESQYFDARDHFRVALEFSPGNPLATFGMIHAEIGAGLYRSAADHLRGLLDAHPELLSLEFEDALAPPAPRVDRLVQHLVPRMGSPRWSNASLLVAYAGRLIDNRRLIEAGLDSMVEQNRDDPLVGPLRKAWLTNRDNSP